MASLAGFILVLVTLGLLVAAPANATYFGPYYADDANHDYYRSSSLSAVQESGIGATMAMLDNTTDMYDTEQSILWAGTDVNFYAVTDSTGEEAGWYAWTECTATVSAEVCNSNDIVFNNHNPHSNYSSLACHEVGHSIGLQHQPGNNSAYTSTNRTCMRSNPDHTDYSVRDIAHINAQY